MLHGFLIARHVSAITGQSSTGLFLATCRRCKMNAIHHLYLILSENVIAISMDNGTWLARRFLTIESLR
ncbi:hypothetical protein BofuT4_uP062890.1 [Botrytis cinerea T4]|uniref:Uncharacterized protein n=1 Tax=Botryotinia fuckeliana (strain T4) TaxID=999810 RepID=G2XTM3_BOTF4|nr:hypothetical protein BofuT4_uP062890.1 [Botrytis cinerea T4]